jgi:Rrf2 family protein
MQITRQADYAVRAILYLADKSPGTRASTAQIARERNIPLTFLAKIVSQLSVAGILHATRGARGGVSLARPADKISLLEIVEAIDGPVALNECVLDAALCPQGALCSVRPVWCEAQADLVKKLAQTNFGMLLKNGRAPVAPLAR